MKQYKRFCKVLTLKHDRKLIDAYKKAHGIGQVWPEITEGMKAIGIIDMEIYINENQLFMIMDTVADFDHDKAMAELATKPRQAEWEAHMSQFQNTSANASADEKWQLLERIFEMDQKQQYSPEEGQLKEAN